MKTILLWDPRFPQSKPGRLTLDDALASAAVRAGVAAAADPAEQGALAAGGALDAGLLTEVVLEHGYRKQLARVMLPYSVVLVGAGLGVLAAIGTPIAGTIPALGTLALTGTLANGTPSSGTITGATSGSTITTSTAGLTVNSGARTYTWDGTAAAGTAISLSETLAGATGSPKVNALGTVVVGSSLGISGVPSAATVGTGLTFAPTFANGTPPYVLSLFSGPLPAGRAIVGNTLQGNYTSAASYSYVLRVTDAVGATANLPVSETVAASGVPVNMQMLNALPANPLIAVLGASRYRQGSGIGQQSGAGPTRQTATYSMSFFSAAAQKDPRFRYTFWQDAASPFSNFGLNGMCFANDGDRIRDLLSRADRVLASDADVVFINAPIGDMVSGMAVSDFSAPFQAVLSRIITGKGGQVPGKPVIIDNIWERGPNGAAEWANNSATKALIPTINTADATFASSNGIPVNDFRSVMTYDAGGGNILPIAANVRSDNVHESPVGADVMRDVVLATLQPFLKPVAMPDPTVSNLASNPTMTGTAGAVSGTGVSGTVPTGYTASRSVGTAATMVMSKRLAQPPVNTLLGTGNLDWWNATIDPSAMGASTTEQFIITQDAAPSLVAANWYQIESIVERGASVNMKGVRLELSDGGTSANRSQTIAMAPTNDGGGGVFDGTNGSLPLGTSAQSDYYRSKPFKAVTAGGRARWVIDIGNSTTPTYVRATSLRVVQVADPTTLLYNESLATGFSITSSASPSFAGDGLTYPTIQITANKLFTLSITGGADAALYAVTQDGTAIVRNSPLNYGSPDDANADRVDDVQITAIPFDLRDTSAVQTLAITSTYAYTGFSDSFKRTASEELSVGTGASAGWTKVGTGTQVISAGNGSGTAYLAGTSGTGRVFYPAPQQPTGPNGLWEQQVAVDKYVDTSSGSPTFVFNGKDADNFIGIRFSTANSIVLYKVEGGTGATLATFALFAPYTAIRSITARRNGNIITVDQAGDPIGTFDLSTLSGFSAAGSYQAWTLAGVATAAQTASFANLAKRFNTRTATVLAAKEGMPALTFASTGTTTSAPGSAGAPFFDRVVSLASGGVTFTMQNIKLNTGSGAVTDTSGTIFMDGDGPRMASAVAGTWTYDIISTKVGAVYSGRLTSMTTVINP